MNLLVVAMLIGIGVGLARWYRGQGDGGEGSDFEVVRVDCTPPLGSTLKAGEPIVAEVHYRYSRPRSRLRLWVQIEGHERSTYEPSDAELRPGTGATKRRVALAGGGEIETLRIVVKDARMANVFEHFVPVRFTVEEDPEMVRLRDDGRGARITGVRFDPPAGSTLKPGTEVKVSVDYAIESERGLSLWVVPMTRLQGSYCPSDDDCRGTGTAQRWFVIGEAGEIGDVLVTMTNVAGTEVCEKLVPAPYTFR